MTVNIDSTPLLIFGEQSTCIIDSIILCNMTDQDIFIDLKFLIDDPDNPEGVFIKNYLIPRFTTVDLMAYLRNENSSDSIMYPSGGDLIYANSDSSNNRFNCFVFYRALLETAIT
jgi:hypothetical protein